MKRKNKKQNKRIDRLVRILRPDKAKSAIFLAIVTVHTALSVGLALQSNAYWLFISILYGIFNFPMLFTALSLAPYNAYNLSIASLLPLAGHLVYWWVIASFIGMTIKEKNKAAKYKYAFYIVLYFLLTTILYSIIFSVAAGDTIANSAIRYAGV